MLFSAQLTVAQANKIGPSPERSEETHRVDVEFSHHAGNFDEPILLELSTPGGRIHFTTDGSTPTRRSPKYKGPISIEKTTMVRAAAYRGSRKSKMEAQTYFINEPHVKIPVVSIGINPAILFDEQTGLYLQGPNAIDSLWRKDGANFWSKDEYRCHVEIYEDDGKREFSSGAGFRLFGGVSRLFEQKSIAIVARDRYGKKRIKHDIFGKKGEKNFKYLVLRNSGSDWGKTHFRDAMITSLVEDWGLDNQDYRPAHVYLNGEYWGLYNIREKINRHFLADHHDIDKDSIDLLEHKYTVKRGGRQHYLKMLRFMGKNDMSKNENYEQVKSMMDVQNFMDYQIAQIFIDNRDAGGNIKFWKPQTPTGKWKWILYDTDWGFGLHYPEGYAFNSLDFFTEPDGPDWPNPPWSTFIIRRLLQNKDFEKEFVRRFLDRMNTTFKEENVLAKIDEFEKQYAPEMHMEQKRWEIPEWHWDMHIDIVKTFAERRPTHIRKFLREKFGLGLESTVNIKPSEGGRILFNDLITINKKEFTGEYFEGMTVNLKAIPKYGWRFSHWEGNYQGEKVNSKQVNFNARISKGYFTIQPIFEQYIHPLAGKIIINEISPRDKDAGDWVELFNKTDSVVDLSNWIFTDNKHSFSLPKVEIPANGHLVICEDEKMFSKTYPGVREYIGDLGFGLNKRGEKLALYDLHGASVDSVKYEVDPIDTVFTMALILPTLDNGDPENWEMLYGQGSPEAMNPQFLQSSIRSAQSHWVRIGVGIGLALCIFFFFAIRKVKG